MQGNSIHRLHEGMPWHRYQKSIKRPLIEIEHILMLIGGLNKVIENPLLELSTQRVA
jgi:hypothetical protein